MSTLDARTNFAIASASTGYTAGAVSVSVETGKGALFPQPSTAGAFNLVWWNFTDYPNPSDDPNKEIVRCTARSGDTLTITRAQEGTLATAKNTAGRTYKLMLTPTAKMLDDIESKLDQNSTGLANHIADTNNPHGTTKAQVGLGNVTNDAQVKRTEMGVANGVASLDGTGKVPTSQLPAIAISTTYVVGSQAAQLALTVQEGDVAVRTDLSKSYIHNGGVTGTMADWQELLTPTDAVLSVNGQTGIVVLSTTNISEGSNLYFTDERAQDAIGAMVDATLVYADATPRLQRAALTGAITAAAGSNTTALGSFTKSQLNTALSDGDALFVGDITQYTDEMAQDAVGAMLADGSLEYVDLTPSLRINLAHSNTFTANQGINFLSTNDTETTAFNSYFQRVAAQLNDEYGYSTIYGGVDDQSDVDGEIDDAIIQKSGFEIGMFRSGTSTVNWIDGKEVIRGYTSYLYDSMAVQGVKHDVDMVGHDMTVLHAIAFTNDGTHVHSIYGNKISVNSTATVSIDAFVTRRAYGEYIDVGISSTGDVNEAYGIYIDNVYSNQVAYAIYSNTTALSHFNGDIEVPDEAYNATTWNGSLEVPTKNAIRDKIESLSVGGITWVTPPAYSDSAGTAGSMAQDASWLYVCYATNSWLRVARDGTFGATPVGDFLLMQNADKFVFQNGDGLKLQSSL